jgi:protein gp37
MSDLISFRMVLLSPGNGSDSRPMELRWVRDLLRQCQQPGVTAVPFVTQLGAVAGRELGAGSKGGDWERWPEDLRFRGFPAAVGAAAAS